METQPLAAAVSAVATSGAAATYVSVAAGGRGDGAEGSMPHPLMRFGV